MLPELKFATLKPEGLILWCVDAAKNRVEFLQPPLPEWPRPKTLLSMTHVEAEDRVLVGTSDSSVLVDIRSEAIEDGDCYLLCSDGLTGMIEDEDISGLLDGLAGSDLQTVCDRLVETANQQGGKDNISVVLVRFTE